MTFAPVLRYPGAKWRVAGWIVSQLPAHKVYLEPFLGSGAIFFAKPPAHSEILNDMDGDVVHLFRLLRDKERGRELAHALELTPWSRSEWLDAKEERLAPVKDPIERARRFLILAWQSHGQRLGYGCGWRHDGPQGAHSSVAIQWAKLPARVLSVVERLRQAQIEHTDAFELIARYNGDEVLLYVDPPYLGSTRGYDRLYTHELTRVDEHTKLLDLLLAHQGPVVLSGYASELYDTKLSSWRRLTCQAVSEKGQSRTEVLWINRDLPRQPNLFQEAP